MAYVEGVVDFQFDKAETPWHQEGVKIIYDSEEKKLHKQTTQETRHNLNAAQIEQIKIEISQGATITSIDVKGTTASEVCMELREKW